MGRIMALESETVETLEAAALQLTPAERARGVDRLIVTSMLTQKSKKRGQRRSSVGSLILKMEPSLYFPIPKPSPN
jgi:hypothetical protein